MTPEILCLEYVHTDFELVGMPSQWYAAEDKDSLNAAQRISAKPLKFINLPGKCEVICAGCMAP